MEINRDINQNITQYTLNICCNFLIFIQLSLVGFLLFYFYPSYLVVGKMNLYYWTFFNSLVLVVVGFIYIWYINFTSLFYIYESHPRSNFSSLIKHNKNIKMVSLLFILAFSTFYTLSLSQPEPLIYDSIEYKKSLTFLWDSPLANPYEKHQDFWTPIISYIININVRLPMNCYIFQYKFKKFFEAGTGDIDLTYSREKFETILEQNSSITICPVKFTCQNIQIEGRCFSINTYSNLKNYTKTFETKIDYKEDTFYTLVFVLCTTFLVINLVILYLYFRVKYRLQNEVQLV